MTLVNLAHKPHLSAETSGRDALRIRLAKDEVTERRANSDVECHEANQPVFIRTSHCRERLAKPIQAIRSRGMAAF